MFILVAQATLHRNQLPIDLKRFPTLVDDGVLGSELGITFN